MPGLDLRPEVEAGGPAGVRVPVGGHPGSSLQAARDRYLHQPVPRGVEVDLVDAMAEPVVGTQDGREGIGLGAPALRLLGAGQPPELLDARVGSAVPAEALHQSVVAAVEVLSDE